MAGPEHVTSRPRWARVPVEAWLDRLTGGLCVLAVTSALLFGPVPPAAGGTISAIGVLAHPAAVLVPVAVMLGSLVVLGQGPTTAWWLMASGFVPAAVGVLVADRFTPLHQVAVGCALATLLAGSARLLVSVRLAVVATMCEADLAAVGAAGDAARRVHTVRRQEAAAVDPGVGLLADLDPDTAATLVRRWSEVMHVDLDGIAAAMASADLAAVGFLAHRMAGSSDTIGARSVAALCRGLERTVRSGAAADPGLVEAIRRQCAVAEVELGPAGHQQVVEGRRPQAGPLDGGWRVRRSPPPR